MVVDGGAGSSRSALAATRALGVAGVDVIVGVGRNGELAARSRHCARSVRVPDSTHPDFASAVRERMAEHDVDLVFVTSDIGMCQLDLPGAELVDKRNLATRAAEAGIDHPTTEFVESVHDLANRPVDFPVVVKPVVGSVPAVRLDGPEDIVELDPNFGAIAVQPFLDGSLEAVAGVVWGGTLRAVVHQRYSRTWPVECGTASAAFTVEPDVEREQKLLELLGSHQGIFQAQFLDGHLIDVNPRPYGSMPLALAAGLNLPSLVVELAEGGQGTAVRRATVGVPYRWLEGDARNLVSQVRTGRLGVRPLVRALGPVRRTAHSVISIDDPRPAILRTRQIIRTTRRGSR